MLGYNGFSATKSLLDYLFHERVSQLLIVYCCEYSAKDAADWYRHGIMY